jgi:HAD superfamily hydrolase (TIGR01549 family)
MTTPAAILDIDGTLVDSNYFHAIAWYRAMVAHGHNPPMWRIHRAIGMGSDQLVGALLGDDVEERQGDDIRAAEKERYFELIEEVRPLAGARELIEDLKRGGHTVVLASSAKPDEVEHYLDILDAREIADAWTTSGDVDRTKPYPDLVNAALERAGGGPAVMVGDTVWDCKAAANAGVDTIAVLTGGFSDSELLRAGAVIVFTSIEELRERLSWTPLG